jgi:hypothetical protein
MSRLFQVAAPIASVAIVASILAGCGATPTRPATVGKPVATQAVKMEAKARKETRAQAEVRAKKYIAEFEGTNYRSIAARTLQVQKIARTDADAAYEFLLGEVETLQELRGEMKNITAQQAEEYEEVLTEELDEMTPDQEVVKKRVAKSEALGMDLDELTILEEKEAIATEGELSAMWGGQARVGSRNRLLSAIQESKLYKAVKRAYKNTRKKVKRFLSNICKKLRWC